MKNQVGGGGNISSGIKTEGEGGEKGRMPTRGHRFAAMRK